MIVIMWQAFQDRPSDRVQKKMENYVEIFVKESGDYAEKMPDYAEISKINKL